MSLAVAAITAMPVKGAFAAAPQKAPGKYDVQRQKDPTPELMFDTERQRFMVGTEADFTVKAANFDIGRVESGDVECAKIIATKSISAREWQLRLKFTKVHSDLASCALNVYPVRGSRNAQAYFHVEDTEQGKAARAKEEEARAKAEREENEQRAAEAQQQFSDTQALVKKTVGSSWNVKFGGGETDKWTLVKADFSAQMKNGAGEEVVVMFNPQDKKWMVMGGNCVYEVTIAGTSAKGKATFCQKASRSAFTATINQ